MYRQQQQPNALWGEIAKIWAVRGMEGESRIEEHWADIIASRNTVRVRQWVSIIVASFLSIMGLAMVGVPLAMAGGKTSFLDMAFIGTLSGMALCLLVGLVGWAAREQTPIVRATLLISASMVIVVPSVLGALLAGDAPWWSGPVAILGICLFVPSIPFLYNQIKDLVDPMGWSSFFERSMAPHIIEMLRTEMQAQKVVNRPIIKWSHGERGQDISGRMLVAEGEEDDPLVIDAPDRDDLNLVDFLKEAGNRGLARRFWLKPGEARYRMPTTGDRVTRSVYDNMVEMAEERGYLSRGADGAATEWLVDPHRAFDEWATIVEGEWGDIMVPVGD